MHLSYSIPQDCLSIYSKFLNFYQLLTNLKIDLRLSYFTCMGYLPKAISISSTFYRSESNQIWYAATLNHSQDYFWIYSKILQFISTFSYSDLGERSYIFCVFRHKWHHTPSINYSPCFFLYLYKKQVDPYLKSLRRQKARPKSKKLIMFCLQLSEIKVSPQNLILFCL